MSILMIGVGAGTIINNAPVYAEPVDATAGEVVDANANASADTNTNTNTNTTNANSGGNTVSMDNCKQSLADIAWIVCPTTGTVSGAVDWLYDKIEDLLVVNPVEAKDGAPIYEIWKYCRGLTNIVFIIFLLVVIYSQLTGVGISNYGLKKALPKLIVAAVLVNLSFVICQIGVDLSNIIGNGLRGLFTEVQESVVSSMELTQESIVSLRLSYAKIYNMLAAGSVAAIGAAVISFESGSIWMLIPIVLGAIVAVASGLITIALRQAVVALLVMISPLAIVAMILPNTENLFKKWRKLLVQMLVFYPMFSLLFGASSLAGFAIMTSAKDGFWLLLGMAVQVFPLFFSWSLMKMSGTFLGNINARMRGIMARPLATNRAWAESRRARTRAYNMQYSMMPYSRLRRYMDNRRALREKETETLQQMRKNEANIYVQRKIGAGYNGAKAVGTDGDLKPNKHTRIAKDAMNMNLMSEYTALDTAHVLNQYGDYFVARDTRRAAAIAEKAKDKAALARLRSTDAEYRRAATGGRNFLELSRAQMTAENDSEADFNFMVSEFLDASVNRDDGNMEKYRHYIESSAGGLGEIGQTRVLGKIIAKAASVESNQRKDINIIANKFPPDKRSFRNMVVGYYVDDDGYATDREGNRIEKIRGSLLQNNPEKLVLWDQVDENGPYFEWRDTNGKFVTKIYKKDKSAVKELLSNFDAPINDPINNLYNVLAGIKEGSIPGDEFKYIGLDAYRTTVGRAVMSAPFKEKNAAFSPMVAEMVKKGYIKNYAQEYLAYLDSLNKATKPGTFNTQDSDAIEMFAMMMDPDMWEEIFPTDLIRGYKNVNGEDIYGYKLDVAGNIMRDANGDKIKVPAESATREELMARIKDKYIFPAAHKITMMMSKQTPNTADNQKAGTISSWKKLKEVFDTKWGKDSSLHEDPYEQKGDMRQIAREVRDNLHGPIAQHVNHHVSVEEMYINSNNDPDAFARDFAEYCDAYPELSRAKRDFKNFVADRGYSVATEELYDFAVELLDSYTNLD